ncbi:MAG: AI-2E family transporter [Gammaproteobacteria bacterium]
MSNSHELVAPRFLISVAAFVIVVAGMKFAGPILVPFLLSGFFAIIAAPVLFWLKRWRVPVPAGILVVVVGIVVIVLAITGLVGSSVDDFSNNMPFYQQRLGEIASGSLNQLTRLGVEVSSDAVLAQFDPAMALNLINNLLGGLGRVFSNGFLIFITMIFMLAEATDFPAKLHATMGGGSLEPFEKFSVNLKRYMAIKTVVSVITGALVTVWLLILGVDFPLLWGLLACLLNFVPTIGSIIAAVPAVLLALIQLGVGPAVLTAAGYIAVNLVMGNFIEPRYMGRGLGLSTLIVFLSLVFWGWVLGPVGMFLSVPLTMTVKIALDSNEHTRWAAVLLGSEVPAAPR